MSEFTTFRSRFASFLPTWLKGFYALRLFWAIALHFDAVVEMAVRAIKLRYPNVYSNETLPLLSRERKMIRGKYETDEQYGERLDQAWQAHSLRGGPYALLEQVWFHYRPNNFEATLIYPGGAEFVLHVDGTIARSNVYLGTELAPDQWANWYLVLAWPTDIADDGTWDGDDAIWDDGGVWDYSIDDLSAAEVDDLRAVPTAWNAEHCFGHVVLLGPSVELWDFPDGTWDEGDEDWDTPGDFEPAIVEIN